MHTKEVIKSLAMSSGGVFARIQIKINPHVVCIFWIRRKRKDQSFFKITEKQPKYAVIIIRFLTISLKQIIHC